MCGIIGYLGNKQALPIILEGLKRMEYRGYDSAGVVLVNKKTLTIIKKSGKLDNLINALKTAEAIATSGLGHIRWATHGEPSDINAHPHADCRNNLAIVHNGIIENYQELKSFLEKSGHNFVSATDSEVLAHLIEEYYSFEGGNNSLEEAVRLALGRVRGAYGLAAVSKNEPDKIVAARLGSPVVLGIIAPGEYIIASDVTAILPFTKEVIYLDDGEIAIITPAGYEITELSGDRRHHKTQTVDWQIAEAEKGGFAHFMLKEIMEQPETIRATLRGRAFSATGEIKLGGLIDVMDKIKNISRLYIVACGTAHYAGRIGSYVIESLSGLPVEVEYASEFRYRDQPFAENSAVLAISQSGETADTLAAIRLAKKNGLLTLGIVNAVGSSIARETQAGVYNHIGPEIAVASTKAFTSQLVILMMLAVLLGRQRRLSQNQAKEIITELLALPDKIVKILDQRKLIEKIASEYQDSRNFIFIGRKLNYPIALEGALKMKEISYVHAEGYPAGELKHGPLALIDETWPVVVIAPQDSVYEKTLSNLMEVKARRGKIIALATAGDTNIGQLADWVIELPKTMEVLSPVLTAVPLQLLAYYMAIAKNLDVDKPRNLAKSVTVE